jgi:hypothetical protein
MFDRPFDFERATGRFNGGTESAWDRENESMVLNCLVMYRFCCDVKLIGWLFSENRGDVSDKQMTDSEVMTGFVYGDHWTGLTVSLFSPLGRA